MSAIVAAVLFGLALLFQLAAITVSVFTAQLFVIAGLLFLALHLAGIGSNRPARRRSRR